MTPLCRRLSTRAWGWALAWLLALTAWSPAARALCLGPACGCSLSTTAVAFTPFNPLSVSSADGTGNVRVSCAGVVGLLINYNLALSKGASGSYAVRTMVAGAKTLNYNLYKDAACTQVWGDSSGSSLMLTDAIVLNALGIGPANNHPVNGRIPAGQTSVTPGGYTDTITVTLTYF